MGKLLAINVETVNIHYTAYQFWEQHGPRQLLLDVVKTLSVNEKTYQRIPINVDGRTLHASQLKGMKTSHFKVELSFVHSIVEMWKLRWLIVRSRSEVAANQVLTKFKHQSGDFIGDLQHWTNSCTQ